VDSDTRCQLCLAFLFCFATLSLSEVKTPSLKVIEDPEEEERALPFLFFFEPDLRSLGSAGVLADSDMTKPSETDMTYGYYDESRSHVILRSVTG